MAMAMRNLWGLGSNTKEIEVARTRWIATTKHRNECFVFQLVVLSYRARLRNNKYNLDRQILANYSRTFTERTTNKI